MIWFVSDNFRSYFQSSIVGFSKLYSIRALIRTQICPSSSMMRPIFDQFQSYFRSSMIVYKYIYCVLDKCSQLHSYLPHFWLVLPYPFRSIFLGEVYTGCTFDEPSFQAQLLSFLTCKTVFIASSNLNYSIPRPE